MAAKFEGSRISFDIQDVLNAMSCEDKLLLIESMSCDTLIIDHVASQIIDGLTESGYCSGVSVITRADVYFGLDKAIRNIARASGEIAKKEIERLEHALRNAEKTIQAYQEAEFARSHSA